MHLKIANHQALLWYNAGKANSEIPSPCGQRWEMAGGQLSIRWIGHLLPQELVDVLTKRPDGYSQDDERVELEDFDEVFSV